MDLCFDNRNNMIAFLMCVLPKADGSILAGTPEQAFNIIQNKNSTKKLSDSDKVDIYIMLNDFDEEYRLTESEVLENYNISKSCLYEAKRWIKANRKDLVKKYDKQFNMFDLLQVI